MFTRVRVESGLAAFGVLVLALSATATEADAASPAAPAPNALVGVAPDQWAARQGTELGLLVNRSSAGSCEKIRVTVDGKSRLVERPTFPLAVKIAPSDPIYPSRSGKIDVTVEGLAAGCSGRVATAFTFDATPRATPKSSASPSPSAPTGTTAGGGAGASLPTSQPVPGGTLASILVPGGSFAEDEPQKLRLTGSGACRLDLTIARVDAAAPGQKVWAIGPLALDAGALLFNGTHFDTLAEGSYSAKAVGRDGCTGTTTIDFKVTPRSTVKTVKGQPKLQLDKKPIAGPAFVRTKDSNVLFSVSLPQSVLDEPSAGCCELEYAFRNAYGAWEVYGGGPIQDSSFGGAMKTGSAVIYKSVSGFREGAKWRVRARAFKYKTSFEWSEWLEFEVDQR